MKLLPPNLTPSRMKRIFLHCSGWTLIVLGIIAFVVPFVPGIILIIIGFALLLKVSPVVKAAVSRFFKAFPKVKRFILRFERHFLKFGVNVSSL